MPASRGQGAVSSSLLYFGASGLVVAAGLISMPIVTRVLTKEQYRSQDAPGEMVYRLSSVFLTPSEAA